MATSKKQSENGSKAASVGRTAKRKATKKTTTKKTTTKKTTTKKTTIKKPAAKPAKKKATKKTTAKSAKKSAKKPATKSTPNPHTIRPERYDNYPARGPVTLTYRNPRARRDQQLTLWVHVDQVIHWMERGLWHHLTPMREGCEVLHIGVGGRFIP